MKHFFNVKYCPFLIKTYVAFPFYLSCFGLKEEEAIMEISKKETSNGMDQIIISLKSRACYLQLQSDQDSSSVPGTVANWF